MKTIESGTIADVIFEGDETKNQIPCLRAVTYAVGDRQIILSQTDPPVTTALSGKRFLITFLDKSTRRMDRYGFWAILTNVLAEYKEIVSAQLVPALVMERESNPVIFNLRMSVRVMNMPNSGLSVFFQGKEASIVNISVGGVCISASKDFSLKHQQTVMVTISIDGRKFDVEGMVIRTWSSQSTFGIQYFASLQFLSHSAMRESLLGNKIMLLDRRRLANKLD